MDYINHFVEDVFELFENQMIRIRDNRVMVDEQALYLLSSSYRMDNDYVLYMLSKVTKFGEQIEWKK